MYINFINIKTSIGHMILVLKIKKVLNYCNLKSFIDIIIFGNLSKNERLIQMSKTYTTATIQF